MQGAPPLASPRLSRRRHLQSLPSGCPEWGFAPCEAGRGVAFRYPEGAWQLRRGSGEQCRQPRRGGTGGEELRRLRWSSPPGQGEQVPLGFILPPPPGTTAARSAGNRKSQPPAGYLHRRFSPCRFRLSPGEARGEAPCIRKQKISPFPPGKSARRARVGGWGKERKLKAGLTGDKEGKPPLRLLERQGQPATRKARPPTRYFFPHTGFSFRIAYSSQ